MSELEEYLENQLEEARLESSGKFSVDYFKARDKMEQFRLPSPAHYLLKVIQAAVLSGAPEVEIRIQGATTSIRFEPAKTGELHHFEAITNGLGAPLEITDPAVRALAQALLGAMLNDWEAVCWRINHHKGSDRLWLGSSGNRTERLVYRAGPKTQCVFTQFRPPNWRFWLSARDRALEHKLLHELAGFAPISIKLDGRSIRQALHIPRPQFFLYQKYWLERPGFVVKLPPADSFVLEGSRRVFKSLVWHNNGLTIQESVQGVTCQFYDVEGDTAGLREQASCRAVLAVDSELRPDARIHFLHHGVALTPLEVELGCPGLQIWLPLPSTLALDLTGFQVIRDEAFQSHLPLFAEMAEEVKSELRLLRHQIRYVTSTSELYDEAQARDWRKKMMEAFA